MAYAHIYKVCDDYSCVVYLCLWSEYKFVLSQYFYEDNLCIHYGQSHANALARAGTEGHVCTRWNLGSVLLAKPLVVQRSKKSTFIIITHMHAVLL